MERVLVNPETGEVLEQLKEGDRILRKTSQDKYKRKKDSDLNGRMFIKVDTKEGYALLKELSLNERALLFVLQYYVTYESGLIQHQNGQEINFNDLIDITGMSRRTLSETLSALISKDIVYKGKNSTKVQYYLNPWVAMKGVVVNPTLKEMFKNYKIRSKGNICWKDLID